MFKISLALSILIHFSVYIYVILPRTNVTEHKEELIQVELTETLVKSETITKQIENRSIIPKENNGNNDSLKNKKFYWGIGVTTLYYPRMIQGVKYNCYMITQVSEGYSAYEASVESKDVIYLIDGSPISDSNDVSGSEPRSMVLTVLRSEQVMSIKIDRVKVYY